MKATKFLAIIPFLLLSISLFAQLRFDPDRQIARLTEELNLNENQQENILEILKNTKVEMEELMEDADDRYSMRGQMREIMDDSHERIEAELDEDQLIKYREFIEERRQQRGQRSLGKKTNRN